MLIDSDVLIWMMRGHVGAATRLKAILPWRISVVTYIELAQGCRNKLELTQAKKGLSMCQTVILPSMKQFPTVQSRSSINMRCRMVCCWRMRKLPPPHKSTGWRCSRLM